jgi:hypothetical protein
VEFSVACFGHCLENSEGKNECKFWLFGGSRGVTATEGNKVLEAAAVAHRTQCYVAQVIEILGKKEKDKTCTYGRCFEIQYYWSFHHGTRLLVASLFSYV